MVAMVPNLLYMDWALEGARTLRADLGAPGRGTFQKTY